MVDASLERTVHVAIVRTDRPGVRARLDGYRSLLSPEERTRERRHLRAGDRERFVIARALVRLQLSRFCPRPPRDWRFETTAHGRPEIAEACRPSPPLRFNVSHTAGVVVCAVTSDRAIGVDVERIDRSRTGDVAARFFAPAEVAALQTLAPEQRAREFFDYWTLKEAYIKARGLGLALPLEHFAFSLSPAAPPAIAFDGEIADDPGAWQFVQAWPTPAHRLALAVRRSGRDLEVVFDDQVPQVPE
jgi:4'-phosphopantetheinyl transferase